MTESIPMSYLAFVAEEKGKVLTRKTLELHSPARRQILVKILACGVCHSDALVRDDVFPDILPRIPGHELIGDVVQVGEEVMRWKAGDRVGGAWHGGMYRYWAGGGYFPIARKLRLRQQS